MSTVAIYSAQISRPALRRWARSVPRAVGASIIAEAAQDLLEGKCGPMKELPFVSRLNARRKRGSGKRPGVDSPSGA